MIESEVCIRNNEGGPDPLEFPNVGSRGKIPWIRGENIYFRILEEIGNRGNEIKVHCRSFEQNARNAVPDFIGHSMGIGNIEKDEDAFAWNFTTKFFCPRNRDYHFFY